MGSADFLLSTSKFRKKMIVRPEMMRRVEVHYVLEYEKNAKSLINVSEAKGTLLHVRTLPDWHLKKTKTIKASNKTKSASFNATVALMTENWQRRWKSNKHKVWTDDEFESKEKSYALNFSIEKLESINNIDKCMKEMDSHKNRILCLTVKNCENFIQNISYQWIKHNQYWKFI